MITNPETLPDDPAALKRMMVELCEQYGQQVSQLNSENSLLHEQIRLLRQLLFGKKSEKLPANSTAVQLPLFDLPEPEYVEPAKVTVEAHDRKKPGRKPLPPELPRVEIIHDLPEDEKTCACGCALSRIGEEVSEQLDVCPCQDPGAASHPAQICLPGLRRRGGRRADRANRADCSPDHPQIDRQSRPSGPCADRQGSSITSRSTGRRSFLPDWGWKSAGPP